MGLFLPAYPQHNSMMMKKPLPCFGLNSTIIFKNFIKNGIDSWTKNENTITANWGYAVQLKTKHPALTFSSDNHCDKLS